MCACAARPEVNEIFRLGIFHSSDPDTLAFMLNDRGVYVGKSFAKRKIDDIYEAGAV